MWRAKNETATVRLTQAPGRRSWQGQATGAVITHAVHGARLGVSALWHSNRGAS